MWSKAHCKECSYSIQGKKSLGTFKILDLKGYDFILGADWIYSHSPISLNLRTRELSITYLGGNPR